MGKKSEQGNIIEIVIIAVLAVAVIGLLVWRFMDNKKTTDNTDTSSQTTQGADAKSDEQSSTGEQTDPNKGYIVLEDWGVRFKSVDSISYKYYKNSVNSSEVYEFTTNETESLCGTDTYNGLHTATLATVTRTQSKPDANSPMADKLLNDGDPINGYYYFVDAAQSYCSESQNDYATLDKNRDAVIRFVQSLEKKR